MRIIVVVEPHPDDAFLSLGWHLEHVWRNTERWIVSVYANTQRAAEGQAYATSVGAQYLCLGLDESRMDSAASPIRPVAELEDVLSRFRGAVWYFPLGLQHPDHLRVAASRPVGAMRYLDTPYQCKQKLAEDLQRKVEGMGVVSLCYPGLRKWRHIPLFKSQAKFFHFNPKESLKGVPETVLESPCTT